MKLPLPVILGLEKVIASVLKLDSETSSRLDEINGKVIRINVTSPPISISVAVVDGNVHLDQVDDEETSIADTTISGSLSALRSLISNNDAVYTGNVSIEGDIGTSQQLKQIVAELDPDWQDAISPYVGDGVTHRLDVAQSRFFQWLERTRTTARNNTSDYLQEELEVLAPTVCVQEFNDEVDRLRADTDRLAARLAKLDNSQHAKTTDE